MSEDLAKLVVDTVFIYFTFSVIITGLVIGVISIIICLRSWK